MLIFVTKKATIKFNTPEHENVEFSNENRKLKFNTPEHAENQHRHAM